MIRRRGEKASSLAFRDILYALNGMLAAVLIFILPSVNPASEEQNQSPPGNLMVAIAWPDGPSDVDLWVLGPGMAKAVGYSNKGSEVWNLLRDDLGNAGDATPVNFENAFSRGLPAGEYVVNLHCFSCSSKVPVRVEVRIAGGQLLTEETVDLAPAQEKTVVRFTLDGSGKVVPGSMSKVFKPLRSGNK
jgi:hypothetical protein